MSKDIAKTEMSHKCDDEQTDIQVENEQVFLKKYDNSGDDLTTEKLQMKVAIEQSGETLPEIILKDVAIYDDSSNDCSQCSKQFKSSTSLKLHISTVHVYMLRSRHF